MVAWAPVGIEPDAEAAPNVFTLNPGNTTAAVDFVYQENTFDSYARQRSQAPEREREKPASVPLPAPMLWFYPVSYTHLDVYKRQHSA